jgi:hypothetical protein
MAYRIPDGWPLPRKINWAECTECGMLYGDGDFDQALLNDYYLNYYGYGINSSDVSDRLTSIADYIAEKYPQTARFVDFGGSGDDGKSIVCGRLQKLGFKNAYNVNAGEPVPPCDVLLASHVIEHVYDMPAVMDAITEALAEDGLLIVDGPDATGLVLRWRMPILDFHTKHINHFRMIDYLRLMERYGFELTDSSRYVDIRSSQHAACVRLYFKRFSTADASRDWVQASVNERVARLRLVGDQPVNVWGLGDVTWHLLSMVDLNVLEYIDNDPAYRGATYGGNPVLERPTNDAPIVIMSQGQRTKLIENIRAAGVTNDIIEI